jgi:signal recognition particle subunit SRP54
VLDDLSTRLQGIFKTLRGQGRVTETVLNDTLREIRLALLEADVHVSVVRAMLQAVREKAIGEEVLKSLSPGQQVVKIVRDVLEALLGAGRPAQVRFASKPPSIFLLVGLQGSGKTTTAAKLGLWLKNGGRYPYLVPADVYRPAAVEQLQKVGESVGLKVYAHDASQSPLEIARAGALEARRSGFDTVLVDTAGRLHIDEALMDELRALKEALSPTEILFIADAMTGQDAVRSAGEFHEALELTGAILTKMDGDARGGAALSIRHVTSVPIKFIGTGERPSEFELFQADRMVGRILGLGDVLTLIEKAEAAFDVDEAKALEKKIRKNQFTLEEFRDQLKMLKKMGPLSSIVSMLPGMGAVREADLDSKAITRVMAIVDSMTPINRLLKQFAQIRRMMKTMQSSKGRKGARLPFPGR